MPRWLNQYCFHVCYWHRWFIQVVGRTSFIWNHFPDPGALIHPKNLFHIRSGSKGWREGIPNSVVIHSILLLLGIGASYRFEQNLLSQTHLEFYNGHFFIGKLWSIFSFFVRVNFHPPAIYSTCAIFMLIGGKFCLMDHPFSTVLLVGLPGNVLGKISLRKVALNFSPFVWGIAYNRHIWKQIGKAIPRVALGYLGGVLLVQCGVLYNPPPWHSLQVHFTLPWGQTLVPPPHS